MSFQQIAGQEQAVRMLRRSLASGRLAHAYLFHGPAGTGKRKAARTLAQAVHCLELADDACGTCAECRKIEHGNHPLVQWIEPEGTGIRIEQIRRLQKDYSYRSAEGRPKVYILVHADRMTTEAANSLLKFLEEPEANVLAILLSDNGHAVLPTLRSRSQWVRFVPMSPRNMLAALAEEGHPEPLIRSAVHLASGIDGARELIQLNEFAEVRNVVIKLMQASRPGAASLIIQSDLVKAGLAEHAGMAIDLILLWLKDLIHLLAGRRGSVVFVDHIGQLERQARTREMAWWIGCMEYAFRTKRMLRTHVNPQLALEQLIIRIQGG